MASEDGDGIERLSNNQIVRLSYAIAAGDMEAIAQGYMNIDHETVKNLRDDNRGAQAFNRAVIHLWMNKNPGPNQAQVSQFLNFDTKIIVFTATVSVQALYKLIKSIHSIYKVCVLSKTKV